MIKEIVIAGAVVMAVGFILLFALFSLIGVVVLILGCAFLILGAGASLPETRGQQSKRFCMACGREIPYDSRLCPYCGQKFWCRKSRIIKG